MARTFFTVLIWSTWPELSLQSSFGLHGQRFFTVLIGLLGQRVFYSPNWSAWPELCFFTVLIGLLGQRVLYSPHLA